MNAQIVASEVRLVSETTTEEFGVVSLIQARQIAEDQGIDLVEISPNAKPPVVKLIDYGKFLYQKQKKISESKKKQVVVALKEIQFRPNIEQHDLDVKLKRAQQFIDQGDRIKMIMHFRGREIAYSKMGLGKFKTIIESVVAFGGIIESEPKMVGNRILAMVNSLKKKT